MALQGTLDSFSLPDVMRLLATTGKTGRLHVDGDRGQGDVWLQDGTVVAATADRALDDAPIDEAVFEILRFNTGSFAFTADEQSPDGKEPSDVEGVLTRAGALLDEWRELEAVVPSLDHRVTLSRTLTVDKVTLDASRWQAVAAIGSGRSVGDLGAALGLGELGITRRVSDLVELGVIVLESPQRSRRNAVSDRGSRSDHGDRADRTERPPTDERRPIPAPPENVGGHEPRRSWAETARSEMADPPVPLGSRGSGGATGNLEDTNGRSRADDPGLPRRSRATGQRAGPDAGAAARRRRAGADLSTLPPFEGGETGPPSAEGPLLPPPLDTPPPRPTSSPDDTGQVPVIPGPSLPADLSWAAEDDEPPVGPPAIMSPPVGTPRATPQPPPMTPPPGHVAPAPEFGRPSYMGGATGQHPVSGPHFEGDTAAHITAMSREARAAVEATVGPSGGGAGFVAARHQRTPDDARQRGALMGFLSSLRR
jgi:hypothetical protein